MKPLGTKKVKEFDALVTSKKVEGSEMTRELNEAHEVMKWVFSDNYDEGDVSLDAEESRTLWWLLEDPPEPAEGLRRAFATIRASQNEEEEYAT